MISSERAASGARPCDFSRARSLWRATSRFLPERQPLARDLIISFWAASERSLWRATSAFLFEPQSSAAPGARKMRQHYADANAVFNALGAVFKAGCIMGTHGHGHAHGQARPTNPDPRKASQALKNKTRPPQQANQITNKNERYLQQK